MIALSLSRIHCVSGLKRAAVPGSWSIARDKSLKLGCLGAKKSGNTITDLRHLIELMLTINTSDQRLEDLFCATETDDFLLSVVPQYSA